MNQVAQIQLKSNSREANFTRRKLAANYISISRHPYSKSILSALLMISVGLNCYCQDDSLQRKLFNNDSIRYDIVYFGGGVNSSLKDRFPGRYVDLNLSVQCRHYLLEKDSTFWMNQLRDSHSDWATNLILYYLYKQNVNEFMIYNNREKWLRIKNTEIYNWSKFFSLHKK
jgi:hypothetical protein